LILASYMASTNLKSIASTPSIYSDIVDVLPESRSFPNAPQVPHDVHQDPMIADERDAACTRSIVHRVTSRRVKNKELESSLSIESERMEELFREGEALKGDIVRYAQLVKGLEIKREEADRTWKSTLAQLNSYQKHCMTLQSSVNQARQQWREETGELEKLSKRLDRLRDRKPHLEKELASLTRECDLLAEKVAYATSEREKLRELEGRLREKPPTTTEVQSSSTQTLCNFKVMDEIDRLRARLNEQTSNTKSVREAIDLIRRCS